MLADIYVAVLGNAPSYPCGTGFTDQRTSLVLTLPWGFIPITSRLNVIIFISKAFIFCFYGLSWIVPQKQTEANRTCD